MMKIGMIRFKNFLSFGNSITELDLSKYRHLCVTGENGSGKSTILDVVTFGLFGKPFRKINKGNLVNSINNSDLYVDISFVIGSSEYRIERGIKPGILRVYKDRIELDQDCSIKYFQKFIENSILKTDYRTFTQVVILGSANFTPFMRMPTGQRRDVIEDILGIRIFTSMNNLGKHIWRTREQELEIKKKKLDVDRDKLKFMKNQISVSTESRQDIIEGKTKLIYLYNWDMAILEDKQRTLIDIDQLPFPTEQIKKVVYYQTRIESNIDSANKQIKFFNDNDTCPTCSQTISSEFKYEKSIELTNKISTFENAISDLTTKSEILSEEKLKAQKAKQHQDEIDHKKSMFALKEQHIITMIDTLSEDIKNLEEPSQTTDDTSSINDLEDQILIGQKEIDSEIYEIEIMKKALVILRDDGAKTMIIDYYLPIINQLIAKYLEIFDFNLSFTFDKEFNETIKARNFDDFSYFNFSEGEKARIDIALLFTWRELAKRRNSIATNIIMLDEMFDGSLDGAGLDNMRYLLDKICDYENSIVISHRSALKYQFDDHVNVTKVGNFSRFEIQ